ncbi:MAG: hypothetical protein Q9187_003133 [Circinaria calcarea]
MAATTGFSPHSSTLGEKSAQKYGEDSTILARGLPDQEAAIPYSGRSSDELKPRCDDTHRKLKARHIQLIGIGGTIGTALFVQIGVSRAFFGTIGGLPTADRTTE